MIDFVKRPYFPHAETDIYDPSKPFFGNTRVNCINGILTSIGTDNLGRSDVIVDGLAGKTLDLLSTNDAWQDLRMGFLENDCTNIFNPAKAAFEWGNCLVHQISPISNRPVCYSTEAVKYSQTAYFVSIVFAQIICSLAVKSRKLTIAF